MDHRLPPVPAALAHGVFDSAASVLASNYIPDPPDFGAFKKYYRKNPCRAHTVWGTSTAKKRDHDMLSLGISQDISDCRVTRPPFPSGLAFRAGNDVQGCKGEREKRGFHTTHAHTYKPHGPGGESTAAGVKVQHPTRPERGTTAENKTPTQPPTETRNTPRAATWANLLVDESGKNSGGRSGNVWASGSTRDQNGLPTRICIKRVDIRPGQGYYGHLWAKAVGQHLSTSNSLECKASSCTCSAANPS